MSALDSMMGFLRNLDGTVVSTLLVIAGGLLGFLAKAFIWDRFISDAVCSTSILLDRWDKGTLGSRGRKRIESEAQAALQTWAEACKPPLGFNATDLDRMRDVVLAHSWRSVMTRHLESAEVSTARTLIWIELGEETNGLVANLVREFDRLSETYPQSGRIVRQLQRNGAEAPRVWLYAPNAIVSTVDGLELLVTGLRTELGNRLNNYYLTLEIHLADSIAKHVADHNSNYPFNLSSADAHISPAESANSTVRLKGASLYAKERGAMRKLILEGHRLQDESECYAVPTPLIMARLPQSFANTLREANDPIPWNVVYVSGPPGSGKTDTCRTIAESLSTRVILCPLRSRKALREFLQASKRLSRVEILYGLCTAASEVIPAHQCRNEYSISAFIDELYCLVDIEEAKPLLIIVDDLHEQSEVADALQELYSRSTDWPVKYLLAGRTVPKRLLESEVHLRCSLFDRNDAKRILKSWQSNMDTESQLNIGWIAEQRVFSFYLLKCISENVVDIEESARLLIERSIRTHIQGLLDQINIEVVDPLRTLREVRRLVEADASVEDLKELFVSSSEWDSVELIGQLAWFSRFEIGADSILTLERIVKWTGRGITSTEMAERLLRSGERLDIFDLDVDGTTARWKNTLVSDGCAALYLKAMIKGLGPLQGPEYERTCRVIAGMIQRLEATNSIQVLESTLDTATLVEAVRATAGVSQLGSVMESLFSDQFLRELSKKRDWVDTVGHAVFQLANHRADARPLVGRIIARLLPLSDQLQSFIFGLIGSGGSGEEVALSAKAVICESHDAYFDFADSKGIPKRTSTLIAAAVWSGSGMRELLFRLNDLCNSGAINLNEATDVWRTWVTGTMSDAIDSVDRIIALCLNEREILNDSLLASFVSTCLEKKFVPGKSNPERIRTEYWSIVVELCRARYPAVAASLMHWIAYNLNRDIVSRDTDWIIVESVGCAFPMRSHPPEEAVQILSKVFSHPAFDIPSKKELLSIVGECEAPELVNDHFPKDRTWFRIKGIERHHLLVLDGKVARNLVGPLSTELGWRPRLSLRPFAEIRPK